MSCSDDGFSGDVELDFLSVEVLVEIILTDYVIKRENVENEQERTKH